MNYVGCTAPVLFDSHFGWQLFYVMDNKTGNDNNAQNNLSMVKKYVVLIVLKPTIFWIVSKQFKNARV